MGSQDLELENTQKTATKMLQKTTSQFPGMRGLTKPMRISNMLNTMTTEEIVESSPWKQQCDVSKIKFDYRKDIQDTGHNIKNAMYQLQTMSGKLYFEKIMADEVRGLGLRKGLPYCCKVSLTE